MDAPKKKPLIYIPTSNRAVKPKALKTDGRALVIPFRLKTASTRPTRPGTGT